jgi:hypothetical protein
MAAIVPSRNWLGMKLSGRALASYPQCPGYNFPHCKKKKKKKKDNAYPVAGSDGTPL